MKRYLPFIILATCFLLLKLTNFGIRVSDTNPYFYMGYQVLQGKLLYKDIFWTNFPLLGYTSALYNLLTFKQLSLYYYTAAVEAVATGFVIYLIALKQTKKVLLATMSSALYLFSFIILATTDHQTGVFLASLFAILSYYFYLEKKLLLAGIFIALSFMTKAYFIPIVLTYGVVLLLGRYGREGLPASLREALRAGGARNKSGLSINHLVQELWKPGSTRTDILKFSLGFLGTVFVVLLPTIIFAWGDLIKDVFGYSLTRSQGLSKANILRFFVLHDLLIASSFIYSLIMIRKHLFFGILAVFSLLFIIFYKDIYFLYLNFLVPFFCLAFLNLYSEVEKRLKLQDMVLPTVVGIFLLVNIGIWWTGYRTLAKIENVDAMVKTIKELRPQAIYGDNSLVTIFAYLSDTPMVNTSIDTNPNRFKSGSLNAAELTRKARNERAVFIAEGIYYPEYAVRQDITTEAFDVTQMKDCRVVAALPVKTEGYVNRVNLIACK